MFSNLDAEMARLRVTQKRLSSIANIKPKSLSNKINGKTCFSLKEMQSIRDAMNNELSLSAFRERVAPYTLDYLFDSRQIDNKPA